MHLRLQESPMPLSGGFDRAQLSYGRDYLSDVDDSHHSTVLVVQYVAVVHGTTREIVEGDPDLDLSVSLHVDDVPPDGGPGV